VVHHGICLLTLNSLVVVAAAAHAAHAAGGGGQRSLHQTIQQLMPGLHAADDTICMCRHPNITLS
jgi:hypothetical protein